MSNVNSVGGPAPLQQIVTQPVQKQVPTEAPKQVAVGDRVELSGVSHLIAAAKRNDIRADRPGIRALHDHEFSLIERIRSHPNQRLARTGRWYVVFLYRQSGKARAFAYMIAFHERHLSSFLFVTQLCLSIPRLCS